MKKKANSPRRKRYCRTDRLQVAKSWVAAYEGKHLVRSYARWFGVDNLCAIAELRILGQDIPKEYERALRQSIHSISVHRKNKLLKKQEEYLDEEHDPVFAFIAGYTSGGFPYGITHEEMNANEKRVDIEDS